MTSMEDAPKDLYDGKILSDEDVKYRRLDSGELVSKANNLWMNVQWPPADADPLLAGQFLGEKIAGVINNPEDRARFEELSKSLANIASWELEGEARWSAVTSEEANRVFVEMYKIARRNGVSNNTLIR